MNWFLFFITLCVVGINAIPRPAIGHEPIQSRVGGGVGAVNASHACMVLVHRTSIAPDVVLGGGTIVSPRRVLTAGHLVHGTNSLYQVGFFVLTSRRMAESTFVLIHSDFNITSYASDIALIFMNSDVFPVANVIPISTTPGQPAAGSVARLVGFGFTNAASTGASINPYAAAQNIANACVIENVVVAPTHVCAIDPSGATYICPGDNGAGLYVPGATPELNLLVGIASRILFGCNATQLTAYTRVSTFATWITNLL